ncbi:response regulator transcription factor [Maritimibacter sp. UBA3975]|uniref:response regulator transcription factor n=1 Tax=Maritimibacter sp. UBA3975 TaxID=1946833 RepID=UPI0025BCEE2D|nr:response regulator transcription factor [Maritimibacter sp. UBA3975]
MRRIAIVAHDNSVLTGLRRLFEDRGYRVDAYRESELALQGIVRRKPELAIVDIELPKIDGFELMERLRQRSSVPVMLLNPGGEEASEVIGLRMGAQDVVAKPVSLMSLLERVRLAFQRISQAEFVAEHGAHSETRLERAPLVMDSSQHRVTWRGEEVVLTRSEFLILRLLAEHPGHLKSRDVIQDRVYGDDVYVADRNIDSYIKRIRQKLKAVDPAFGAIETVYGLGYRFEVPKNTSLRKAS